MGLSASQSRLLALTSRMSDLEFRSQQIANAKVELSNESNAASKAYTEALDKQSLKVFSGLNDSGEAVYEDATAYNLTHYDGSSYISSIQRFIKNAAGAMIVDKKIADAYNSSGGNVETFLNLIGTNGTTEESYYTNVFNEIVNAAGGNWTSGKGYDTVSDENLKNSEWLQAQINNGNVYLYEYSTYTDNKTGLNAYELDCRSWKSGDNTLALENDDSEIALAEAMYDSAQALIKQKDSRYDMLLKSIDTEHSAIKTELETVQKVIEKNIESTLKLFDA